MVENMFSWLFRVLKRIFRWFTGNKYEISAFNKNRWYPRVPVCGCGTTTLINPEPTVGLIWMEKLWNRSKFFWSKLKMWKSIVVWGLFYSKSVKLWRFESKTHWYSDCWKSGQNYGFIGKTFKIMSQNSPPPCNLDQPVFRYNLKI